MKGHISILLQLTRLCCCPGSYIQMTADKYPFVLSAYCVIWCLEDSPQSCRSNPKMLLATSQG
jgi:hypothetical protein